MNPNPKDTVIVDIKGRFLAVLDGALDQKDVKIVVVATNKNATEDDDWMTTMEEASETAEAPTGSLARIVSAASNNTVFSMNDLRSSLLVTTNTNDSVTSDSLTGEMPYIDAFFDPCMITESREIASEGCFSAESSSDDNDSDGDNDDCEDDGCRHQRSIGMSNGAHYDRILSDAFRFRTPWKIGLGRGKLAITFVLYDLTGVNRIFIIQKPKTNSQKEQQWMLPTVVVDSSGASEDLTLDAALDAFAGMTKQTNRLRTYAHKIVPSGKHHAILLARVEIDEMDNVLNTSKSGIVGTFMTNEKVYKNMLRRLFDRQRPNLSAQVRRTFMKLKSAGVVAFAKTSGGKWTIRIVGDKLSSRSKNNSAGDIMIRDDSDGEEWSDDDDDVDDEKNEEGSDKKMFSYYALDSNEMLSIPMSSENWHHFYSGVKTKGGRRGGGGRGRSSTIRAPRMKRSRSLPATIRRGLRRIGLGPRPGIPIVRRPFTPKPWGYGRGSFRGHRRIRPWLPFLPLAYLGFSNRFYPQTYYHISPGMPYYDNLPRLPSIPMGASADAVESRLYSLRRENAYYMQRGYDIVPNFSVWRYQWVSTSGNGTADRFY